MKQLYSGKTKDVFESNGELLLRFKDSVTGEDGRIDPGANNVLGQVEGKGNASLRLSSYFFHKFIQQGIPNHFISAKPEENMMVVKKAETFGAGLEFICRLKAYGSFLRRYGAYAKELQDLNYLVEITLKDDLRGDPLLNEDTLIALGIMNAHEVYTAKELTQKATKLVENELKQKELQLIDIKFEFGRVNGEVVVIDEVSGDNMRVRDKNGNFLLQKELCAFMLDA
ncbi:MAG: phosphoribosylaminoimidazolesuccinocarboxamide synthase [bacterium]|jgi:phosphoribosylaminoimidazole-succinocarboxamide synthase